MSNTFSGSDSTRLSYPDPKTLRTGDRIADVYVLKSVLHSEESEPTVWLAEDEVSGDEVLYTSPRPRSLEMFACARA